MSDEKFLLEYEKLLDKGYCDCNEMNCIDNDSPRRILRIAKSLQQENQKLKSILKIYKTSLHREHEAIHRANDLEDENQELNKQLETVRKKYEFESKNRDKIWKILMEKETHQKKFIEWLENYINKTDYEVNVLGNYKYLAWSNAYKNALTKYKEIIGGKGE